MTCNLQYSGVRASSGGGRSVKVLRHLCSCVYEKKEEASVIGMEWPWWNVVEDQGQAKGREFNSWDFVVLWFLL